MRRFLFKLFGSVRLVQEVTRSDPNTSSSLLDSEIQDPSSNMTTNNENDKVTTIKPIQKQAIEIHPPALNPLFPCYKAKSKFTIRHYPKSLQSPIEKSKSQKLLCLWPLPTVTRYMILIALVISTLNWLQVLDISCSAPSYIIHQFDFKNLLLSPFIFDWTLQGIIFYGWNLLILGLFEESLTLMLVGGTKRFIQLLIFIFFTLSTIRLCLGFTFSKSTGWAFPCLFFSNSMHECSQGKSD